MSQAEIGGGDVTITLDGQELTLKPTLEACMAISKLGHGNGAAVVTERLVRLDFDTVVDVISIGIGASSGAQKKQVAELVFKEGVMAVAGDAILFVRCVNNGGVLPKDEDEGGEDDADAPLSQPQSSTAA